MLTPAEIVERIESIADGQPDLSELWEALELLQNELLSDSSGDALELIRARRHAEFEANRKPSNNQILTPREISIELLNALRANSREPNGTR